MRCVWWIRPVEERQALCRYLRSFLTDRLNLYPSCKPTAGWSKQRAILGTTKERKKGQKARKPPSENLAANTDA